MDITQFVVSTREGNLIDGNYGAYRKHMSKKLLNCRKKLNIATKHRGKSSFKKAPITAAKLGESVDYVRLHILTSERAWAHAMSIKTLRASNSKSITGAARSHMISRLEKAASVAEDVVDALSDTDVSGATETDLLEAEAYACLIRGAHDLEKQDWDSCLASYSTARVIYAAIATAAAATVPTGTTAPADLISRGLLTETIDPSIRYAAYQLKLPGTLEIPVIARRAFPKSDADLLDRVAAVDPDALHLADDTSKAADDAQAKHISWGSRQITIDDPAVATAWGEVEAAKADLAQKLASPSWTDLLPKEKAAAYDDLLISTQDAVDATKTALDELSAEGGGSGNNDKRHQDLLITRTAISYEMISWRIGRNRILCGEHDGALLDAAVPDSRRKRRKAAAAAAATAAEKMDEDDEDDEKDHARTTRKEEAPSKMIARLKEKVALYDSTLQSLETVKNLPGLAQDKKLISRVDATYKYFYALKCLSIARSHSLTGSPTPTLALIKHANAQTPLFLPILSASDPSTSTTTTEASTPSISVSPTQASHLSTLLTAELARARALLHVENLQQKSQSSPSAVTATAMKPPSLATRITTWPQEGPENMDLTNLVPSAATLEPVPVKPLFFDVAWNYVEYPHVGKAVGKAATGGSVGAVAPAPAEGQTKKKGWFGFGS